MILIFISLFIILTSFNLFTFAYQLNGVSRVIIGTPVSLFETAINVFEIDETEGPKFNKDELENNLTSYYSYSLTPYCRSYSLSFYYYNPLNHSICFDDECEAIEVNVDALLMLNFHYTKTMFYELRSN